jgi:hypothetical protein
MTSDSNTISTLAQERIKSYMDYVLEADECQTRYLSGFGWVMAFEFSHEVELRLIGDAAGLVRRRGTDLFMERRKDGTMRLIVPFKKKDAA